MSDSTLGSPAAGAVDPGAVRARLSDMGAPGNGMPTMPPVQPAAEPTAPATPSQPAEPPQKLSEQLQQELTGDEQPEGVTPEELLEAPPSEESELPAGELTPEQIVDKYKQWMESDEIPEEFLDRPIWIPNGKKGEIPVRLRDIGENVLMYNDYQQKTTQLAERNRDFDRKEDARKRWFSDFLSGDPKLGLRAINAVGGGETLHNIVVQYIRQEAMLESLPPEVREQYRAGMQAQDRAALLEQQMQFMQQQGQQQEQQELESQGMDAPDIQYTLQSIEERLPAVYQRLGIQEGDEVFENELSRLIRSEVDGQRDPRTGEWVRPPGIQIGRAPSDALINRLAVAAKQNIEQAIARHGARLQRKQQMKLPPTPSGTGPAAKPGQRGNLGQPQRKRFSDLA